MNKTLTISVIALVAVIMGMSAVAPVMAQRGGSDNAKTCDEISDEIKSGRAPPEAIARFLEQCRAPGDPCEEPACGIGRDMQISPQL